MPGTRARRAREYRAWARSLELIDQRSTPANCVKRRLVDLVYFVYLVHLVYPVSLVQPNKRDEPNKPNNGLLTLADFFSILLMAMHALRQKLLNPSAHLVEPLSCLEIRKEIGQVAPHSLAVPIHHG